ncbi:MAG: tyrosine-type recombinase/integrase [Chloroflexi bacterium]|nr:tyrosine-type recombinase/integrase [Chloroflexota bacterium]
MDELESSRMSSQIQSLSSGEIARKIGKRANQAASVSRILDYRSRRAEQTLRRQDADLLLFREFLAYANFHTHDLAQETSSWQNITWGLVEAFTKWQLTKGYAIQSINVRLSTIKTYARLAMQGGSIQPQEYALIRSVQGYSFREQTRIDQKREITRIGLKKSTPIKLDLDQAKKLKDQPDTPQGRRDTFLLCLLLDHGLRVGEVAALAASDFSIEEQQLRFFHPKVNKEQIHKLSTDTLNALRNYQLHGDMPQKGLVLRRSKKNQELGEAGMSERAITGRVATLGEKIGISGLSAHDCRHFWATSAARHGTDPFVLQEAGGWSSLAMPRRYVENNHIANEGVKLE